MFSFNKVIRTLIFTDFIIYSGWGLVAPIFAVFIIQNIEGGDASVAGIASGIYLIVKSLTQIPIGRQLDKNHGERDDFWFMVIGMSLASLVPLGYLFVVQPWHLYSLQALYGVAMAMAVPSWGGIFARHIDGGKEAETWGAESSFLGLGMGMAGIVGGVTADIIGFAPLFIAVSVLGFLGVFGYFIIRPSLAPRGRTISFPKH